MRHDGHISRAVIGRCMEADSGYPNNKTDSILTVHVTDMMTVHRGHQ